METTRPTITIDDAYMMYDNMLDECFETVRIGSLTYAPSDVLRKTDPIAYRCGFLDYINAEGYEETDNGEYVRVEEWYW
jgi:hypothetical protein